MKRVKRISRRGLWWSEQYAEPGDVIAVYPLMGEPRWQGEVSAVKRNRAGRVSYIVDGRQVFTEELTPLHHKGMNAFK